MAILRNVEIWYTKLDPERPDTRFNKLKPRWNMQLRTDDPAQKDEWKAFNLQPKLIIATEGEDEGQPILNERGKKEWRVNVGRNSVKAGGVASDPVEVVDGQMNPIDPKSIGNGSRGNIRLFQYEYDADGVKKIASVLMAVQLTYLKVYVPTADEGFEELEEATVKVIPEVEGGLEAAEKPALAPVTPPADEPPWEPSNDKKPVVPSMSIKTGFEE